MKKKNIIIVLFLVLLVFVILNFKQKSTHSEEKAIKEKPINAMMMLIEFEKIDGILQWEKELDSRNLTAMVKVQDNVLDEYPKVFKRLADKGYEIAGGYDKAPFWDMPYDEQYKYIKESKELVERTTGKKMKVFGSRYFAYDENTLKAASDLDVEYILARGTRDVEAVVYQPKEYSTKIISVTNVDVGEMGRGSLCDYSLWARGLDAKDFGIMVTESVIKKPENMILVSHAYLGGTRLEWWKEYEKVLNSNEVKWVSFDDWLKNQDIIIANNNEIPLNKEVKYVSPKSVKPMEDYEAIPGIEILNDTQAPTGDELMCQ